MPYFIFIFFLILELQPLCFYWQDVSKPQDAKWSLVEKGQMKYLLGIFIFTKLQMPRNCIKKLFRRLALYCLISITPLSSFFLVMGHLNIRFWAKWERSCAIIIMLVIFVLRFPIPLIKKEFWQRNRLDPKLFFQ